MKRRRVGGLEFDQKVYEHKDVEIYRGYRRANGVSHGFEIYKIEASELELEGGPKLHDKIVELLAKHTVGTLEDDNSIFRIPKDEKAARKIRLFILREILREFARKPSEFFAWLEQDRREQRRQGASDLRCQLKSLIFEGDT
jgi:hypothetical protein